MIVTSDNKPDTYEVSGNELRVHWDIIKAIKPGLDEDFVDIYEYRYREALCNIFDTKDILISKIIRSIYSIDAELATINNSLTKPEEYEAYQNFRTLAKSLASNWILK